MLSRSRVSVVALVALVGAPVALAQNQTDPKAEPSKGGPPRIVVQPVAPGVKVVEKNPNDTKNPPANPDAAAKEAAKAAQAQQNPVPGATLQPALKIDAEKHDFGDIADTDPVEHTFNFTNITDQTITIAVAASCGCTVPTLEKNTFAPGETGKATARFDPKGRIGPQTKTLTFTVTNPQGKFAQQFASLTSNVKALVVVEPPKMYLNEVDHRSGQKSKITITGRKADFKIVDIKPTSEFVKVTVGEPTVVTENNETLTRYVIDLDVGRNAPIGNFQSTLNLTTNDERARPAPIFVGADIVGDIKSTPTQAILRINTPNTPFTTQIRLDSRSGSNFNITGLDVEGPATLRMVPDVQKGEDGTYFMITLSGVTPAEGGMINGNLVVTTDAQGGETMRIPFTGVVQRPQVANPNVNRELAK